MMDRLDNMDNQLGFRLQVRRVIGPALPERLLWQREREDHAAPCHVRTCSV